MTSPATVMSSDTLTNSRTRMAQVGVPLMIVSIVMVMVVPLPAGLVDMLIALNITIAIVTMLTAMMVEEPLHFSVFPALLLVTTLFRLALNISTTRLILRDGNGGRVIETFGGFVVGDNIVIGLVIFLILIVIQFAVITTGAGRVAEVSARFTLDAMPGKQMGIDADLNSGAITEAEAKMRRQTVAREADFYGSMDGASKFVKGDTIASVVIVIINLVGGIAVGVFQQGLSAGESVNRFALLSVGDGLVSQIPALLISVASGIIVTRAVTDDEGGLGTDLWLQLVQDRRVLSVSAGSVLLVALMPGLPKAPFLFLATLLGIAASRRVGPRPGTESAVAPTETSTLADPNSEEHLLSDIAVEPLELVLAADLFDLVDPEVGGTLLDRVKALRRKTALDLGLVIPLVRSRDDVTLPSATYVIRVNGVEAGRGVAPIGKSLVLMPGDEIAGDTSVDPIFGLPAAWVAAELAGEMTRRGKTVIDRSSVIVTHLSEIIKRNASALLSRQSVQELVEGVAHDSPAVANEVGGDVLSLAQLHSILGSLLDAGIPVRDLTRILEATTAKALSTDDPDALVDAARLALSPAITAQLARDGVIRPITLDPVFEQTLLESIRAGESGPFLAADPVLTERLVAAAEEAILEAERTGHDPVIVCSAGLRRILQRLLSTGRPGLRVVSYAELAPGPTVEPLGVVSVDLETV